MINYFDSLYKKILCGATRQMHDNLYKLLIHEIL